MWLKGFALECSASSARRVVSALFGTNRNYLRRVPRDVPEDIADILGCELPLASSLARVDLELQIPGDLLDISMLKAMVVPDQMLETSVMQSLRAGMGASVEVRSYQLPPHHLLEDSRILVEEHVVSMQEHRGLG